MNLWSELQCTAYPPTERGGLWVQGRVPASVVGLVVNPGPGGSESGCNNSQGFSEGHIE